MQENAYRKTNKIEKKPTWHTVVKNALFVEASIKCQ